MEQRTTPAEAADYGHPAACTTAADRTGGARACRPSAAEPGEIDGIPQSGSDEARGEITQGMLDNGENYYEAVHDGEHKALPGMQGLPYPG